MKKYIRLVVVFITTLYAGQTFAQLTDFDACYTVRLGYSRDYQDQPIPPETKMIAGFSYFKNMTQALRLSCSYGTAEHQWQNYYVHEKLKKSIYYTGDKKYTQYGFRIDKITILGSKEMDDRSYFYKTGGLGLNYNQFEWSINSTNSDFNSDDVNENPERFKPDAIDFNLTFGLGYHCKITKRLSAYTELSGALNLLGSINISSGIGFRYRTF